MKKTYETKDNGVEEMLNLAKGTFSDVTTFFTIDRNDQMRLSNILLKEELNILLCELLIYFSKVDGDEDTVKKLEDIRNGGKDWHLYWLDKEPWVSHLFFKDWLIGQRALSVAENELAGMPNAFEQDMREQLSAYSKDEQGRGAIQVIEKLIALYEERNRAEAQDVDEGSEIPDLSVILQTLWIYAHDIGRMDLCSRILRLAQGVIDGKSPWFSVGKQKVKRFVSQAGYFKEERLFKGMFDILSQLPGCYDVVADTVHGNATPLGFERNLMLLGKVDAVARHKAKDRLVHAKFPVDSEDHRQRHALLLCDEKSEICQKLNIFEVDGVIPWRIGEIAGRELFDKLLTKMLHRSAKSANSSKMGEHRPVWIESKCLRDGYRISAEELDMYLYGVALDVLCFLKGWKRWMGDRDNDNTIQILGEIGGEQEGMNIPVLRFLYGGESSRNLIEYFYDLTHAVLDSKTSKVKEQTVIDRTVIVTQNGCGTTESVKKLHKQPNMVSLNAPQGEDDNGKEITLEDKVLSQGISISDQADSMGAVEESDEKVVTRDRFGQLMAALRKFNSRFADHFWLEIYGMRGFTHSEDYCKCKNKDGKVVLDEDGNAVLDEDAVKSWKKFENVNRIDAKQIRILLKIGGGNTHWYGNMAKKFASELRSGKYDDIIKLADVEKIAQYFFTKATTNNKAAAK